MSPFVSASPPAPPRMLADGRTEAEWRLDVAYERLQVLASAERRLAALRAEAVHEVAVLAEQADAARGVAVHADFVDLHLAGTLGLDQDSARCELMEARHLRLRLPRLWQALSDGLATPAQVRAVVDLTLHASAEVCAAVEERILGTLSGRTVGSLRRAVRKLLQALVPQAEQEAARRRAVEQRGVRGWADADGMAGVTATMPAGAQVLFLTALRRLAGRVTTPGDTRTDQQRMSDVLACLPQVVLDMLAGGYGQQVQQALRGLGFTAGRPDGSLRALLLVPVGTALGVSDEPGELRGHGPVSAEHARQLLLDATVQLATVDAHGRLVAVDERRVDLRQQSRPRQQPGAPRRLSFRPTGECDDADDGTGEPAGSGTTAVRGWQRRLRVQLAERLGADQLEVVGGHGPPGLLDPGGQGLPRPSEQEAQYRPSRRLGRLVRDRDRHCVGPGCTVPSRQCDLEHRLPWPHGPTSAANLSPVSRHCHRAKQAGWSYERHPDGSTAWAAPFSTRRYLVRCDL